MIILDAKTTPMVEILSYFDDVVAIPTETVYGLAAGIYNEKAIRRVFEVKGRPSDNPIIVHVSSIKMLESIIDEEINLCNRLLIERFWPGPLTLLFKVNPLVSKLITGGLDTVAVRMPNSAFLLRLIETLGFPLAAPSANLSGRPSPTTLQHVIDDLQGRCPVVLDGGDCIFGIESTVLSCMDNVPTLLRPGNITKEELESALNTSIAVKTKAENDVVLSPGQKYKHYAPCTPVILFKGKNPMKGIVKYLSINTDKETGILHSSEIESLNRSITFWLGTDKMKVACNIFRGLRALDNKCQVILVEGVSAEKEGMAVMDRLEKAASQIIECD